MSLICADHPCWSATYDRCGEGDETEYGGSYHYGSEDEAKKALKDSEWEQAQDGSWLCSGCWDEAVGELPCPNGARCSAISCCMGSDGPRPATA